MHTVSIHTQPDGSRRTAHPSSTKTSILASALTAAALACMLAAGGAQAAVSFDVAITVDDLSAHGPLPRGQAWPGIATSYVDTLKRHRVSEAYGFVNAKRITESPESEAVLDLWRKAGYPLGNHTYSHMGLSQAPSIDAWQQDVKKGEPAISGRMKGGVWQMFRFPFLDAGKSKDRHDAAIDFLTKQGYRIADVSMSFDDWAYTDAYTRCLDKGDTASITAMKNNYFKRVDEIIVRTRAVSQRVYKRIIPHVLLTHMGAFSAATLNDTMKRLDAAGARYVPLWQAQYDQAYQLKSDQAGNGMLMERRAADIKVKLDGLPTVSPIIKMDNMCR